MLAHGGARDVDLEIDAPLFPRRQPARRDAPADSTAAQGFVSAPFELRGATSNVVVETEADVDGEWLFLDYALVNEATGEALWLGVRALQEKEELLRRVAALDREASDDARAVRTDREADRIQAQAATLRKLIKSE